MKIDFKNKQINFWDTIVFVLQKKIKVYDFLKQAYNQNALIDKDDEILFKFIEYIKNLKSIPRSQIFQDIFASFVIGNKFDKTFLEFGATDGISLSNTHMLEKELGWSGVLAEPDIQWIDSLKKNRPNTKIITKCIWKKSNEKLNFFSSDEGVLSTLEEFKYNDIVDDSITEDRVVTVNQLHEVLETTNPYTNALKVITNSLFYVSTNTVSINAVINSYYSLSTDNGSIEIFLPEITTQPLGSQIMVKYRNQVSDTQTVTIAPFLNQTIDRVYQPYTLNVEGQSILLILGVDGWEIN